MAVKITREKCEIFGNLVVIENGIIQLKVSTDFGPRVLHYSLVGKENIFFNDKTKKDISAPLKEYNGETMKLYGGHRLWCSPENMPTCYYPDNYEVKVVENGNTISFIAPIEKYNHIQKTMEIEVFDNSSAVSLVHRIKNCGSFEVELGVWCVTMMDKGGKAIMPMPTRKTTYLANRNFSFWEYSDLTDKRFYMGKNYLTLTQDENSTSAFKFGYNNESGWGAYVNKEQIFVKYFEPEVDGYYPDNNCCFEAYTNESMLELESLSQLQLLGRDQTLTHVEEWELFEEKTIPINDENQIEKIIAKVITV